MPPYFSRYRKLNGNTLKVIACISMLLDHVGAAIIYPLNQAGFFIDYPDFGKIKFIYDILRILGRISFPIFCFLLIEGFFHTRSRLKYALSLLCFAFISEHAYDSAFDEGAGSCNVMFTLFLGLITVWTINGIRTEFKKNMLPDAAALLIGAIPAALAILFANYIHCDYHGYGIALILIFYLLKKHEPLNIFAGYLFIAAMPSEAWTLPAFILLLFYNQKQGKRLGRLKYLFYALYPVHLYVFYLIRCALCGNI